MWFNQLLLFTCRSRRKWYVPVRLRSRLVDHWIGLCCLLPCDPIKEYAVSFLPAHKTGVTEGESWALGLRLSPLVPQTHGNALSLSRLKGNLITLRLDCRFCLVVLSVTLCRVGHGRMNDFVFVVVRLI